MELIAEIEELRWKINNVCLCSLFLSVNDSSDPCTCVPPSLHKSYRGIDNYLRPVRLYEPFPPSNLSSQPALFILRDPHLPHASTSPNYFTIGMRATTRSSSNKLLAHTATESLT